MFVRNILGTNNKINLILRIADIFSKSLKRSWDDHVKWPHGDPAAIDLDDPIIRTYSDPKLALVTIGCGLALVELGTGRLRGGMLGHDLVLDETLRRCGLGREIVAEYFARNGDLPTWHLDKAAYSRIGIATFRSAWRWLSQQDEPWDRLIRMMPAGSLPARVNMVELAPVP